MNTGILAVALLGLLVWGLSRQPIPDQLVGWAQEPFDQDTFVDFVRINGQMEQLPSPTRVRDLLSRIDAEINNGASQNAY